MGTNPDKAELRRLVEEIVTDYMRRAYSVEPKGPGRPKTYGKMYVKPPRILTSEKEQALEDEMLRGPSDPPPEKPPRRSRLRPKEEVLADLTQANEAVARWQEELNRLARESRDAGASWSEIGRAVGVATQTAYQRWAPKGASTLGRNFSRLGE